MNKLWIFAMLLLCFCLLPACAQASSTPINPGDQVGSFLVTTGTVEEVKFLYELDESDTPSDETEVEIPWGTKIVATYGIYDDQYSGKLDEVWASAVYALEINGRPVNLEAFGTIEKKQSSVGTVRHYNVVIEATKPGKLTMHHVGKVSGEDIDDTFTMRFLPAEK